MINWFLSIMVHTENITFEEAEKLSEKLATTTHPHKFADAHEIVEEIFADIHKYDKPKKRVAL